MTLQEPSIGNLSMKETSLFVDFSMKLLASVSLQPVTWEHRQTTSRYHSNHMMTSVSIIVPALVQLCLYFVLYSNAEYFMRTVT